MKVITTIAPETYYQECCALDYQECCSPLVNFKDTELVCEYSIHEVGQTWTSLS